MSKPPRLGRGLAGLLGEITAEPGIARAVPVHAIEPGRFQPRGPATDGAAFDDLVASIRARGVLQPLLARPHPDRPEQYQLIAGERRWRAAQIAGLDTIPVFVRELSDQDALAAALVENLQRSDLNAMEEAAGLRRLLTEHGLTQDQLAAAVGKSRSHVANLMRLLGLPDAIQIDVRQGRLSAGHARALLAHPEPERAALQVIARGLTVRQTEMLARAAQDGRRDKATASAVPTRPTLEESAIEQELGERLGLKVIVRAENGRGAIRVFFQTLDQLDGLVTLLRGPA